MRPVLPPETYNTILLHIGERELHRLAAVSRLLFHLAIPYLWHDVELEHLLALLPGDKSSSVSAESVLEVRINDVYHTGI